jgi:hypothetical protein
MKRSILTVTIAMGLMTSINTASAMNQSDALENIASVMAAQEVCGFTVNQDILQIAIQSTFGSVDSVAPGGEHWPKMRTNMSRIHMLTDTESGRASFCARVRSDLSAFFD